MKGLLRHCILTALCGLFMCTTGYGNTIPNPNPPTPPPITPGGDSGGGNSSQNYNPGSAYGSSSADREFRGFFETSIKLTQSLWEGGATEAQITIQKARLGTAGFLLHDAAASLAFDAIACHVDMLRRREMVRLAEENVKAHERILNALHSRLRDGLATVGDMHQVQGRLARARGSQAEYESYLLATEATFLRITGKRAPSSLNAIKAPAFPYSSTSAVSAACQAQHPRIQAALAEVKSFDGEKKLAASRDYPHFNAEAGPRWYFQDTERDQINHGFDAMLVMRWNLYEGGATASAKEAARAKQRQARQVLHRTMDTFAEDIDATWARYESAQRQAHFYDQGMQSAKAARVAFYDQYMLGTRNLLDVLDAENDYFSSASQYMIAKGDRVIAAWRLLALAGDILATLRVDVATLQQTKNITIADENNLTRAAARYHPPAENDLRVRPTPHTAATQPLAERTGEVHIAAAYAERQGNELTCKIALRNESGIQQHGEVRITLITPDGEQVLNASNTGYALRQGLDKKLSAALPPTAPESGQVRYDVLDNRGSVLSTKNLAY